MIKNKIETLCKEKNISVRAVEKASNLSNGTISKWNEVDPGVSKLKAVADFLNVSLDYFFKEQE